jgi:hypothetical protein
LPAPGEQFRTPEMVPVVGTLLAARALLARTVPTSLAGLVAVAQFVREQSVELEEFLFDGDDEILAFIISIERAARTMADTELLATTSAVVS